MKTEARPLPRKRAESKVEDAEIQWVVALLSKSWFRESLGSPAYAYIGNLSASFAVFFVVAIAAAPKLHRIWIAAIAIAIVDAFELTNAFGVMTNVYDPFDFLANGLGVALAFCVDLV